MQDNRQSYLSFLKDNVYDENWLAKDLDQLQTIIEYLLTKNVVEEDSTQYGETIVLKNFIITQALRKIKHL